ncbi:MAG TPA: YajQ family cyclic di-GMP-binding protein [Thermoanaerobaculia bacterium]|nr:YajQ family cyclic di-GMP-binding protein [Thermoanaerobaculia bacterium]
MADPTFDVVSEVNLPEAQNAVAQAQKEVAQRYDLKGSSAGIEHKERELTLTADTDFALKAVNDILQTKLVKRGVSLKSLDYGKVEPAAKGTVRQVVTIQQGIATEKAKEIVKAIKDSKLKVQVSMQGEQLRVSGKKKDDLQAVIALLRGADFGIPLQFTNFRG